MGEIACGIAVEDGVAHTETVEQTGKDDTTHAVDGIHTHAESRLGHGRLVYQPQCQDSVDMLLVEAAVAHIMAEMVDVGIFEILLLGDREHLVAIVLGEELTQVIEQFQCVPLTRVVARGDDDSAISAGHGDSQFGGGGGGQPYVDHIIAHTDERTANHTAHHLAGDASVAPHDNTVVGRLSAAAQESGIS